MLGFCQNWFFGQKFDFSNSVFAKTTIKKNFILQEMEKVVQSLQSENQRLQTLFASTSSQDSCESYKSVDDEVQDVHDVRYKVVNDNNIFLLCFSSRKTFLSHTKNFFWCWWLGVGNCAENASTWWTPLLPIL